MKSESKIYPMKEFRAIFPISSILVIRYAYAKEGHFSILAVFQKVWDLHKFGLQIWIQNAKITLSKNFGQFFQLHRFLSSGPCMRNKVSFQYYLYFKIYRMYINLGCIFEFRTQKLPNERISDNFFNFIDFSHQVPVCETSIHFSILALFQNVWDLHKFGLQIWIQNGKITLWKNFGQFFQFHRSWSSGLRMRKKVIFNISCISMYGIYNNLGCRFEFRTQKLPYERILGNFSDFIDFGHQVCVGKTRSFLNISCISQCMRFT